MNILADSRRALSVLAASSVILIACGDDTTGAGGGGGSSSSGEGGATSSSTGGDGGSTTSTGDGGSTGAGDGGGGGAPVDPSTLPDSGRIGFYQFGEDAEVSATFRRGRDEPATHAGGCDDEVVVGSCRANRCYGALEPDGAPLLDAGAMTVSGLPAVVSPEVDDRGGYLWRGQVDLFDGDEALGATFSGADVPAFTATLARPPRISSFEPADPTVALTAGEDLEVSWTAAPGAVVMLQLVAFGEDVVDAVICELEGDDLGGVVPGELIPTTPGTLVAYTLLEEHVAVGDHDVALITVDLAHQSGFTVD